jgi:DNA-binding response OmpR family regulator
MGQYLVDITSIPFSYEGNANKVLARFILKGENVQDMNFTPGMENGPVALVIPAAPCLLVVEDNPAVRACYAEILKSGGYHFDLAENGEAGWESIQERVYSLIVTDHDMPRLTGLGLIKRLDEQEYRVPVILISGSLLPGDSRLVGLCLLDMISKPVSGSTVLAKIKAALSLNLPHWFTHPLRRPKRAKDKK